jgi:hypothetical protein
MQMSAGSSRRPWRTLARAATALRPRGREAGLRLALVLVFATLAAHGAAARTIFVTPTGVGPGYAADGRLAAERTEAFSTDTMRTVLPGDVVQLLLDTPDPAATTAYRAHVVLSQKTTAAPASIVIRGLGARTRLVGRTIEQVRDCPMPEDLAEHACGDLYSALAPPRKPDLLAAVFESAVPATAAGGRAANARLAIPIGRTGRLADAACLDLDRVDGVVVEDLTFQDCWLVAVRALGSRRVTLRRALVIGGSYGLAARGRPGRASDHITVEDVTWIQDASGYDAASLSREGPFRCRDGRMTDLGCPGLMWRSIPWGVSHHGTYEHFNGALLGGADLEGPVVFRRNTVLSAYNGVRLKASGCEDLPASSLSPAICPYNAKIWISENLFSYIRDNPVELETWAIDAHVVQNRIHNAHAWFSFDDMAGGPVYIYGNRGWFDDMPALGWSTAALGGPPCRRSPIAAPAKPAGFDPTLDRRFDYLKARWLPVGIEAVDASGRIDPMDAAEQSCAASVAGRVVKLALPPRGAAADTYRYPTRGPIYLFNNSWYLRAPVTGIGAAANLRHWNNAILFCEPGTPGYEPELCKVRPETFDAAACGQEFIRSDDLGRFPGARGSLPFFDCFRWLPLDENGRDLPGLASAFDHDVSSNGFPQAFGGLATFELQGRQGDPGFRAPERGDFTLGTGALARTSACRVDEADDGHLACRAVPADTAFAGAVAPDGRLYEPPASERFRPPD